MDFNSAKKHVPASGLIPKGTVVPVHMTVRPGGAGTGGWLKRNKDGTCMMIDAEFTVTEGPYARRKFWSMFVVEGETAGQQQAADITGSLVRAMLEAAKGIMPDDESDKALAARRIVDWGDLDGLRFQAVVSVRKQEGYDDKNTLSGVITPDRKDYERQQQSGGAQASPVAAAAVAAKAASSSRPSWA